MTRNPLLDRPALTAIAAVLALLSQPALAQDAALPPPDVTTVSPVIVPEIPAPAPATPQDIAPAPTPSLQTVQSLPASPSAEPQGTEKSAPATAPVARSNPATRSAAPRNVAPTTASPVSPVSAPAIAPLAVESGLPASTSPSELPSGPVEALSAGELAQPEPASAVADRPTFLSIMGGSALALLAGAAGLTFLTRRDRRPARHAHHARRGLPADWVAEPATKVAPATVELAPAVAKRTARAKPAGKLEAMVDAVPSKDNPFLTRRARLRRAQYILANGHAPEAAPVIAEVTPVESPAKREKIVNAVWAKPAQKQQKPRRAAAPLIPSRQLKPATS